MALTVTQMRDLLDEIVARRGVRLFDIPASGEISAGQINEELGRPFISQFNIGGSEERALAGVPTGEISFSDFHGKTVVDFSGIPATIESVRISPIQALAGYRINMDGTHETRNVNNFIDIVPQWSVSTVDKEVRLTKLSGSTSGGSNLGIWISAGSADIFTATTLGINTVQVRVEARSAVTLTILGSRDFTIRAESLV